ncbi:hypothetical protein CKAN_01754600 [Cinnamomum micranthum f. kanehirae]|uniref:BED-type domain-containing protein n=1 Tax=Cinnamomum micranthum f. kanehirae TaxID=337451 RepID=A0A3S3NJ01_9MAGN|nr:hypothetical protein CKAN_01754600 [Cinnamomum micranthum f. kanehirae]
MATISFRHDDPRRSRTLQNLTQRNPVGEINRHADRGITSPGPLLMENVVHQISGLKVAPRRQAQRCATVTPQMSSEGSNKKDPAWQYAHLKNPQNNKRFKYNFCGKISNGGVYRVKQHLAEGYRNGTACPKCPTEVREEIR